MDARPLSIACIAIGLLIYLGAVSGLLFEEATPPGDAGALTTLVSFLLFGGLGLALARRQAAAAPA